jgi:hypothetical protein
LHDLTTARARPSDRRAAVLLQLVHDLKAAASGQGGTQVGHILALSDLARFSTGSYVSPESIT